MNPLFLLKDCLARAFSRKWVPAVLFFLFLCSTMCGIVFIKTPMFFEYHLRVCDRFLDRVCYSDKSVFLIFIERTTGNAMLLVLALAGIHPAALPLPLILIAYRGYTMGGTLAVLFSVYEFPGALVALALYFPVQLLIDAVLLVAASLSFERAFRFTFCRSDGGELLGDFLCLLALVALICLLEAILLLALFHPVGNLL